MQSLPLFQGNKKKSLKQVTPDSAELSPSELGKTVVKAATHEGKKAAEELWREILGIKKQVHDMAPGVDYSVKGGGNEKKQHESTPNKGAIDYVSEILRPQEHNSEARKSEQRVAQLVHELQTLAKSIKQVEKTMVLQAVGQKKQEGKYYESFFEWMILFIQDTRKKVDTSNTWLSAMNGKSKRKQQVGKVKTSMNLFLSGERSASNQTG